MSEREITLSATDLRKVHNMMESMIDMLEGDPTPSPSPWETERSMLEWLNKRLSEAEQETQPKAVVWYRGAPEGGAQ